MKARVAVIMLLTCAACRHRAPVALPPVQAPRSQPRTARVPPRPAPAPSTAPVPETPAARVPQDLQSSADSAGDRPAIEVRLRGLRAELDALRRRTLPAAAAQDRDRLAGMVELAQQALNRGNLRQAEELSTRAAMLARTLTDADNTLERRGKASAILTEHKLDALLITDRSNVRYLTGFTGSNGWLLLRAADDAILYTDPRYTVQSKQQANCRIRIAKGLLSTEVLADVKRSGARRIGVEQDSLTVGRFEALKKGLPARAQLVPVSNAVAAQRMVKDAGEIAAIRKSVDANSRALEAAVRHLKPGMTELAFAAEIDYRNRRFGAEALAFDTIVAAGERAALPHARPGNARIGAGMVLIDMGAFHDGYASDMTRMLHIGKASAKYKETYRAVLEAQLAGIDAVRPGIAAGKVDLAVRAVLKGYGLDKQFVHSTGHGLGLEIHEPPRLGRKDKTKLAAGMAITIEPGVYLEGWGGIRIEDTVLVTETGCEILTPTAKELREL